MVTFTGEVLDGKLHFLRSVKILEIKVSRGTPKSISNEINKKKISGAPFGKKENIFGVKFVLRP